MTDTQGWLLRHLALDELNGSMKSAFYLTFHLFLFFPALYLDANFNLTRHIKNPEKLFSHPAASGVGSSVDFTRESCVLLAACYTDLNGGAVRRLIHKELISRLLPQIV